MKSHSVMECYLADTQIAELEAENARLRASLEDRATKLSAVRGEADRLRKVAAQWEKLCEQSIELGQKAEAEASRLRDALEEVEWIVRTSATTCAWCKAGIWRGHKPDCARQLALAKELPQNYHKGAPVEERKEMAQTRQSGSDRAEDGLEPTPPMLVFTDIKPDGE